MPDATLDHYRVYCEECDIQKPVASRILAEDIVEGHEEETGCSHADWEAIDDE